MSETPEERYYDALKRIASYMDPERLRREAEKLYGLPFEEALECAYDNVLGEARAAVKGRRRPKGRSRQGAGVVR